MYFMQAVVIISTEHYKYMQFGTSLKDKLVL